MMIPTRVEIKLHMEGIRETSTSRTWGTSSCNECWSSQQKSSLQAFKTKIETVDFCNKGFKTIA